MRLAMVKAAGQSRLGAVVEGGLIDLSARFKGRCADIPELLAKDLVGEAAKLCAGAKPDFSPDQFSFLPLISRLDARIFALGKAYKDHQLETGGADVEFPSMFSKHPQSLVGHEQALVRPRISEQFDYEGEILVVIGKPGRHIRAADAMNHVAGYSILMDGSVRDWQKHSVTAGKNFDNSSSCGPWLVTRDEIPDWKNMVLSTRLNGKEMQKSAFGMLMWDLGFVISYISTFCRLGPGDAIATGTPAGVGHRRVPPVYMKAGDILEVEVSGIGILRNPVIDE